MTEPTIQDSVDRVRTYVDYPYNSPETLVVDSELVRISADDLAAVLQGFDALQAERDALRARVAELEAKLRGDGIMPRFFGVWTGTGMHVGVWDDGVIAANVASEYPGGVVRDLIDATVYRAALKGADHD